MIVSVEQRMMSVESPARCAFMITSNMTSYKSIPHTRSECRVWDAEPSAAQPLAGGTMPHRKGKKKKEEEERKFPIG